MSHGCELPPLASSVQKKCVPPGSLLYEQVLDDLRNYSSPASTSSLSSSSSSFLSPRPNSAPEGYTVTVKGELCSRSKADCEENSEEDDDSGDGVGHDTFRPCSVCSKSRRNLEKARDDGWGEGDGDGSCVHICDFIADLKLQDSAMGHNVSLLHHKHHKREDLAHEDFPSSFPHQRSSRGVTTHKRRQSLDVANSSCHKSTLPKDIRDTSSSRSASLPPTSAGHVISWSAESGFHSHTDEEDCEDKTSGRSHPRLSRLYPRGSTSNSSGRLRSPSPVRAGSGNHHHKPFSARNGNPRARDGVAGADRGKPCSASPHRRLLPDVPQTRLKPGGCSYRLSPSASPTSHRAADHPRGQREMGRSTPSPSPSPSPSSREHIRLCRLGLERDVTDGDFEFPALPDSFRLRSQSDVSVHAQRRRQVARLPLLRQSHVEDDCHMHVHWADEERGSPLATSVLLTSIRPRAWSHGAVDPPRKPILKKPLGF